MDTDNEIEKYGIPATSRLEYLQRKLNGIRRQMKLTGYIFRDRKRYNNASLSLKVKVKKTMSRIEVIKKEIGQ